jgi:hypothetical protein
LLFKVIHTIGHIHNFEKFVAAQNTFGQSHPSSEKDITDYDLLQGLISTLSLLPTTPNGTWINPVRKLNSVPIFETLKSLAGVTGIIMCLSLSIIVSSTIEHVRRSFFNLFWYTHQIFAFLFVTMFFIHGLSGIIRSQTNLDRNNPLKCYQIYSDWSTKNRECDIPQFAGAKATTWIWVIYFSK